MSNPASREMTDRLAPDSPAERRARARSPLKAGSSGEEGGVGWSALSRESRRGRGGVRGSLTREGHAARRKSRGGCQSPGSPSLLRLAGNKVFAFFFLSISHWTTLPTTHCHLESNSHLHFLMGAVLGSCVCRKGEFTDMYLHLPLVLGAVSAVVCTSGPCGLEKLDS